VRRFVYTPRIAVCAFRKIWPAKAISANSIPS
jgi:hypothetical protein